MDLGLLQQVLLNITEPSAHIPIQRTFESLKLDRMATLTLGSELIFHALHHECKNVNASVANGMIFGIVLAYCLENPASKEYLEAWVSAYAKSKGENVVDFLGRKAKQNGRNT